MDLYGICASVHYAEEIATNSGREIVQKFVVLECVAGLRYTRAVKIGLSFPGSHKLCRKSDLHVKYVNIELNSFYILLGRGTSVY